MPSDYYESSPRLGSYIRLGGKIIWIDLELKSYSEEILPEYGWGVGHQSWGFHCQWASKWRWYMGTSPSQGSAIGLKGSADETCPSQWMLDLTGSLGEPCTGSWESVRRTTVGDVCGASLGWQLQIILQKLFPFVACYLVFLGRLMFVVKVRCTILFILKVYHFYLNRKVSVTHRYPC